MTEKRKYEKPLMRVVKLQHRSQILIGSAPLNAKGAKFDDYEDGEFSWEEQ